jgi:hypothetical protein
LVLGVCPEFGYWGLEFPFLSMKRLTRLALTYAGAAFTLTNLHAGDSYTFDQSHSTIGFEVHHLLGKARGQFHLFSGMIDLDRDHPERSSVVAKDRRCEYRYRHSEAR